MTLLERLNERWERMNGAAATKIDRILKERREAAAEIERLRQRLFDCETSLNVWDDTRDSEYWMRYGEPSTLEPVK